MNTDDLPIDIHYNKLLDWLINRRHCQQQWQASALDIRQKINAAIQDMPPVDEITTLLQGTYINYFHCLRIIELLKATEDGSKNLFGRYSSQRMKDWIEILNLYSKDGVFLAEAAQLLNRNVNYEIAALKRQIAKCQQAQNDCTRKEGEYASNSAELKEKYHISCRQIGIQGNKVKTELLGLVKDMPTTYQRIEKEVKGLKTSCDYYATFVTFMLSRSVDSVPLLRHLIERGNTTTYEWKRGAAPSRVEEVTLDFRDQTELETGQSEQAEIDWGNLDAGADTIDYGISMDDSSTLEVATEGVTTEGGIDWGDGGTANDISIEVVDDSLTDVASNTEGGVARGSDALSVLDNPETRNIFINELLELQAFLRQRVSEMSDDTSVVSGDQFTAAPSSLQIDVATVQDMLGSVSRVVDELTSKKMQDLFLIRSSPRYVDRMAETLKKTLQASEKMMSLSRLMVTRRQEASQEEHDTQPKLDLIRQRTKELQKQIEEEVSKKYKNRRVNIMGEINTI